MQVVFRNKAHQWLGYSYEGRGETVRMRRLNRAHVAASNKISDTQ